MGGRVRYGEAVLDHCERPRNVGSLAADDPAVGSGRIEGCGTGEVVRLQIRLDDAGRIEQVRFKAHGGCGTIAACSLLTEWLGGRTTDEAEGIAPAELAQALGLPVERLHCATLAVQALRAAIADWRGKRAGNE